MSFHLTALIRSWTHTGGWARSISFLHWGEGFSTGGWLLCVKAGMVTVTPSIYPKYRLWVAALWACGSLWSNRVCISVLQTSKPLVSTQRFHRDWDGQRAWWEDREDPHSKWEGERDENRQWDKKQGSKEGRNRERRREGCKELD